MADKTVKTCDVWPSKIKDVSRFQITLECLDAGGEPMIIETANCDMSPAAVKRARRMINQATNPPGWKAE